MILPQIILIGTDKRKSIIKLGLVDNGRGVIEN